MHVRDLLAQLAVSGDLDILATALLAPMEVTILDELVGRQCMSAERVTEGWEDLARRLLRG
jgi:hypothetical protein